MPFKRYPLKLYYSPEGSSQAIAMDFDAYAKDDGRAKTTAFIHYLLVLEGAGLEVPWKNLRYRG